MNACTKVDITDSRTLTTGLIYHVTGKSINIISDSSLLKKMSNSDAKLYTFSFHDLNGSISGSSPYVEPPLPVWTNFTCLYPVSTGIGPQSLPERRLGQDLGFWRICLCPKVPRIAEHKFGSC